MVACDHHQRRQPDLCGSFCLRGLQDRLKSGFELHGADAEASGNDLFQGSLQFPVRIFHGKFAPVTHQSNQILLLGKGECLCKHLRQRLDIAVFRQQRPCEGHAGKTVFYLQQRLAERIVLLAVHQVHIGDQNVFISFFRQMLQRFRRRIDRNAFPFLYLAAQKTAAPGVGKIPTGKGFLQVLFDGFDRLPSRIGKRRAETDCQQCFFHEETSYRFFFL